MSRLTEDLGSTDHVLGQADAPVSIVEYGDFECPYCAEAVPQVQALLQALGDQACFAFRHFPLTQVHPHAERAAELAEAAASENLFWPMHGMLYAHQDALDDDSLVAYARTLGLSRETIQAAFDGEFRARVRHDFMGGVRSGVNGTPCFFINGLRYEGPADAEAMLEAIGRLR